MSIGLLRSPRHLAYTCLLIFVYWLPRIEKTLSSNFPLLSTSIRPRMAIASSLHRLCPFYLARTCSFCHKRKSRESPTCRGTCAAIFLGASTSTSSKCIQFAVVNVPTCFIGERSSLLPDASNSGVFRFQTCIKYFQLAVTSYQSPPPLNSAYAFPVALSHLMSGLRNAKCCIIS